MFTKDRDHVCPEQSCVAFDRDHTGIVDIDVADLVEQVPFFKDDRFCNGVVVFFLWFAGIKKPGLVLLKPEPFSECLVLCGLILLNKELEVSIIRAVFDVIEECVDLFDRDEVSDVVCVFDS